MVITERAKYKPIVYASWEGKEYRINRDTGNIKVKTPYRLAERGWIWRDVNDDVEAARIFVAYMKAVKHDG